MINGGVVNLNGTRHTKASHCPSQITGNLQGNLPIFKHKFSYKVLNAQAFNPNRPSINREFKTENREII